MSLKPGLEVWYSLSTSGIHTCATASFGIPVLYQTWLPLPQGTSGRSPSESKCHCHTCHKVMRSQTGIVGFVSNNIPDAADDERSPAHGKRCMRTASNTGRPMLSFAAYVRTKHRKPTNSSAPGMICSPEHRRRVWRTRENIPADPQHRRQR